MPRSDFYILPSNDSDSRRRFLCKVLEKVHGLGHQIYIRTADEAAARQLDELLWEYCSEAFLPHNLIAEKLEMPSPIEIGYGDSLPQHREVYVNMALEASDLSLSFERIIEVVIQQDEILEATRNNYRQYQQRGYEIHMNDMRRKG
ncbi:MAG: DNA polymerase III subunit chi [Motiliproteus sp.]